MKIVLSGYAGVGKSTILKKVKKSFPNVFIINESAREVEASKDFYKINDPNNIFFQKSILDNEIMKILLIFENKIEDVLFDRSIIDNLTFASLFYDKENINFRKIQIFIDDIRFQNKIDYLYDKTVFIKSTKDENFVENFILNDPFRKKTTHEESKMFIKSAEYWEEEYFNILNKFSGISQDFKSITHFNDNINFNNEIDFLLDKTFKKP